MVNNLGQRTSVTTSGEVYATAPADRVWSYDSLGQVVTANDNHYTYDQIGNRTTIQKGTEQPVTYTPNSLNQYAVIGTIIPTYDGNGNITEYLTEENSGFVAAHYEYDAFGNIVKKSGEKEYEYQFSTKPYNNITGQLYYNYRDYDSVSGRWIGRDPIEEYGGVNLYSFLLNNAVNFWDYLGLKVYVVTYKYSENEMKRFFDDEILSWTKADSPKYPNINVEFGDNSCKAKIGNVEDIDIVVALNLIEGTPSGYTNRGADTIRFHEYRRVMVYQKAHDAYLSKIKSTLNGKTMECKKAGESFLKLSTYKDKIINLYLDAYTNYVMKNQAEIEKEGKNVIRDKNNLIDGISSAHSVDNPMEVDVPEFPSCDD